MIPVDFHIFQRGRSTTNQSYSYEKHRNTILTKPFRGMKEFVFCTGTSPCLVPTCEICSHDQIMVILEVPETTEMTLKQTMVISSYF